MPYDYSDGDSQRGPRVLRGSADILRGRQDKEADSERVPVCAGPLGVFKVFKQQDLM